MDKNRATLYCSFCGKSQHEVIRLIAGPTVFICDECIILALNIIIEDKRFFNNLQLESLDARELKIIPKVFVQQEYINWTPKTSLEKFVDFHKRKKDVDFSLEDIKSEFNKIEEALHDTSL